MSLAALVNTIETSHFSSFLGLSNNRNMFLDLIERQPVAQELLVRLKDPSTSRELLARIESLTRLQDDVRYRNQRDAALAVYIWALDRTNHSLGKLAASIVLDAPRLWWARKTALDVLAGSFVNPVGERESKSLMPDKWNTTAAPDRSESLITLSPPSELIRSERVLDPSAIETGSKIETGTTTTGTSAYTTTNSSPTILETP